MHKIIAWFHGLSTQQKMMVGVAGIGVPLLIYYVHKHGLGTSIPSTIDSGVTSPTPYGNPNILGTPTSGGLGDTGSSGASSNPVDSSGGNQTVQQPVDTSPITIPGVSGDPGYYPQYQDPYGYGNSGNTIVDPNTSPYGSQTTNQDTSPISTGITSSTATASNQSKKNNSAKGKVKHSAHKNAATKPSIGSRVYQGNATFTKNLHDITSAVTHRITTNRPKTAQQAAQINKKLHSVAGAASAALRQSSSVSRTSHANAHRPQEKPIKIGSRIYQGNATFTHGSSRTQITHPVLPGRSSSAIGSQASAALFRPSHPSLSRNTPFSPHAVPQRNQKAGSNPRGRRLV